MTFKNTNNIAERQFSDYNSFQDQPDLRWVSTEQPTITELLSWITDTFPNRLEKKWYYSVELFC